MDCNNSHSSTRRDWAAYRVAYRIISIHPEHIDKFCMLSEHGASLIGCNSTDGASSSHQYPATNDPDAAAGDSHLPFDAIAEKVEEKSELKDFTSPDFVVTIADVSDAESDIALGTALVGHAAHSVPLDSSADKDDENNETKNFNSPDFVDTIAEVRHAESVLALDTATVGHASRSVLFDAIAEKV